MKRRDFVKGALITAVAVTSAKTFAGEYKEKYQQKINRLSQRENPSLLEQKHVPEIKSPATVTSGQWFDLKVNVGFMKEHPSTPGHWITLIKLLVDGKEVAKTDFIVGGISASSATFRMQLSKSAKIEAIEHCNLHGTWLSEPVTIMIA